MPKTKILTYAGIGSASLLVGLPVFLTLGPVFNSPNVSAEETASKTDSGLMSLSVGSALAVTAEDVSIDVTPTAGNTFVTTTSTVNVRNTGSSGGYHLIMTTSSEDNGALTNVGNTSNKIEKIDGYSETGIQMREANVSSWGFTLQDVSGTNAAPAQNNTADILNTYYPVPISDTQWGEAAVEDATYKYLKNTNDYSSEDGDDILVGFGFAIGPDAVAGIYTDTITYTAIANKDNRTLFDMTKMQDLAKYKDACYNTPTPAVVTEENNPASAVTATMNKTQFLAGYRVKQVGVDKIPTVNLADVRDSNSYEVRKLADGNCWMTQDLLLMGKAEDSGTGGTLLSPTDSNIGDDSTFRLPVAVKVDETQNSTMVAYVVDRDQDSNALDTTLYNFYAATAGKGATLGKGQRSTDDICPKGWHLPNSDGNASWDKLLRTVYQIANSNNENYSEAVVSWGTYYNLKTATGNPLGFHITGSFASGYLVGDTKNSYYWTRDTSSGVDANARILYYSGGKLSPRGGFDKGAGYAVRCVSE